MRLYQIFCPSGVQTVYKLCVRLFGSWVLSYFKLDQIDELVVNLPATHTVCVNIVQWWLLTQCRSEIRPRVMIYLNTAGFKGLSDSWRVHSFSGKSLMWARVDIFKSQLKFKPNRHLAWYTVDNLEIFHHLASLDSARKTFLLCLGKIKTH